MEFLHLFLEKTGAGPLYGQLYRYLVREIQAGRIQAGEKLPSKRAAATQLGLSINTVDTAYQMLAAEGYVAAKPRSGFVVAKLERQVPLPPEAPVPAPAGETEAAKPRYSFATGGSDPALFPRKMWNRILREVMAGDDSLFLRGNPQGDEILRLALAEYLQGYRGVRCTPGQIVVGAGLEVLVGMLGRLFAGEKVAVENPGYAKTARILLNVGVPVRYAPVDGDGMLPEPLYESKARLAYLTPSHQYPTGGVMPVGRRMELLRWAQEAHGYILEDDYDSEFRFDGRPLPSLQGLDEEGRVAYAGTFSRSLAPGLRAAFLVLPPRLLARWNTLYGDYACTISRPEQHTLARFMLEGHFARSLNRMRGVYKKRRNLLLQELARRAPKDYSVENAHTGLYLLLRLPSCDARQAAQVARQNGVAVHALEEYVQQNNTQELQAVYPAGDALVLGYGGLPEEDIPAALGALFAAIQ